MTVRDGQILGISKIVDHGPDSLRYNLVFLSDGYTAPQLADFVRDVDEIVEVLRDVIRPYRTVWPALNIHRIDVASAQSGTDDPFTGVAVRTFFDAGFMGPPNPRHWMRVNSHTIQQVCRTHVPPYHGAIVLANAPLYGGMTHGTDAAIVSMGGPAPRPTRIGRAAEVVGHELGHVLGLADEYSSDNDCTEPEPARQSYQGPPIAARNVVASNDPAGPSWFSLLTPTSPTVPNPNCQTCGPAVSPVPDDTVGRFEGAFRFHCGVLRSEFTCLMRGAHMLCQVCSREVESIMDSHGPRLESRGGASWQAGSTTISPFRIGDDRFLLRWRPTSFPINLEFGLARVQPAAAGLDITLTSATDTGALLVPLNLPDPFLFQYGRFNLATVSFDRVATLSPISSTGAAILPPTFSGPMLTPNSLVTAAVAFDAAGSTFMLLYSSIVGQFAIVRVRPDGSGLDQVVGGTWRAGLFAVTAVAGIRGATLLLGHDPVTGTIEAGHFDPLVTPPTFTAMGPALSRPRPPGFTSFSSFVFYDSNLLLLYIPGTLAGFPNLEGVARYERIYEVTTGPASTVAISGPVRQPTWPPGLVVAPFELAGDPHLASYSPLTGDTVLERIR